MLYLTNLIINLFGVDASKARRYAFFALIGLLLLIVLFFGWLINSCRQRNLEKKIDRIEGNIKEQETIANVLTNQKIVIENQVENIARNANEAKANFNQTLKKDSTVYNSTDAEDKFCRKFCHDLSCDKWRERNPNYFCD